MRPANSSYDAAVNRSLEQARDLLKKYGPGEVIPYEALEEIDDLGFNEVIEPQTVEVAGEGFKLRDPRRIACIFQEPDGRFYWCDNDSEILDARGRGHHTKADAMRSALFDGFTHATGSGTYWEGVRKIPAEIMR